MKISTVKARKYHAEGRVFPLKNTSNCEIWGVQGLTGVWSVRYDKLKDTYSCNCGNIRLTECSHIKSVRLEKGEEIEEEI